jgi:hypothetical protein
MRVEVDEEAELKAEIFSIEWTYRFKYCKKCDNIKPPRAHHCALCDKCIFRQDHHCPFVGNCIGLMNHKFFLQFLLLCLFNTQFSAHVLYHYRADDSWDYLMYACYLFTLPSSAMSLFTFFMVVNNWCTIESLALWKNNIFRDQPLLTRWCYTMGNHWWQWFLPFYPPDPLLGLNYHANIPCEGVIND